MAGYMGRLTSSCMWAGAVVPAQPLHHNASKLTAKAAHGGQGTVVQHACRHMPPCSAASAHARVFDAKGHFQQWWRQSCLAARQVLHPRHSLTLSIAPERHRRAEQVKVQQPQRMPLHRAHCIAQHCERFMPVPYPHLTLPTKRGV